MLGYLPLYITKESYNFEILNTGNDDSAIRAVVEKRADISVSDPIMFSYVDYEQVRIVKAFINKPFLWLITFNPFLKDIKNKTLVTFPEPSTTYHFAKKLQKENKLKLFQTSFNTELGPLLTQEADISLVNEPNFTQAMMNGAHLIESFINKPFAFTGFCSEKNHETFFKELERGIKIFYEDEEQTLKIAKKYFALKEEVLKKAIQNLRKARIYNTEFTKQEIEEALKLKGIKYAEVKKYIKI